MCFSYLQRLSACSCTFFLQLVFLSLFLLQPAFHVFFNKFYLLFYTSNFIYCLILLRSSFPLTFHHNCHNRHHFIIIVIAIVGAFSLLICSMCPNRFSLWVLKNFFNGLTLVSPCINLLVTLQCLAI